MRFIWLRVRVVSDIDFTRGRGREGKGREGKGREGKEREGKENSFPTKGINLIIPLRTFHLRV